MSINVQQQAYLEHTLAKCGPVWTEDQFNEKYDRYVPSTFGGVTPVTLTGEQALKIIHIKADQEVTKTLLSIAATVFTVAAIFLTVFVVATGCALTGLAFPVTVLLISALLSVCSYYWTKHTSEKELNSIIAEARPQ